MWKAYLQSIAPGTKSKQNTTWNMMCESFFSSKWKMVSAMIHLKDIPEFIEDSLKTAIVCGWSLVTLVKMSFTALFGGSPTKSMIIFTWVLSTWALPVQEKVKGILKSTPTSDGDGRVSMTTCKTSITQYHDLFSPRQESITTILILMTIAFKNCEDLLYNNVNPYCSATRSYRSSHTFLNHEYNHWVTIGPILHSFPGLVGMFFSLSKSTVAISPFLTTMPVVSCFAQLYNWSKSVFDRSVSTCTEWGYFTIF